MESVLRASAIFVFLLLVFRVTGKRSLAQITNEWRRAELYYLRGGTSLQSPTCVHSS